MYIHILAFLSLFAVSMSTLTRRGKASVAANQDTSNNNDISTPHVTADAAPLCIGGSTGSCICAACGEHRNGNVGVGSGGTSLHGYVTMILIIVILLLLLLCFSIIAISYYYYSIHQHNYNYENCNSSLHHDKNYNNSISNTIALLKHQIHMLQTSVDDRCESYNNNFDTDVALISHVPPSVHTITDSEAEVVRWNRAAPLLNSVLTGDTLCDSIMCLSASSCSILSDIHQHRGADPAHIGVANTNFTLPYPLTLLAVQWRFATVNVGLHTASKSSPVVDDRAVYVGADTGRLYAVDKFTGNLIWVWYAKPCKNGIHATPAVDSKHVYIADYAGWGYAINKRTGKTVWETKMGHSIGASPTILGNRVYWSVEVGRPPNGYLAVTAKYTGAVLFYGPAMGDNSHGTPTIQSLPIKEEIGSNTTWCNGRIFIGANTGDMFAYDLRSGHLLWRFTVLGRRALPLIRVMREQHRQSLIESGEIEDDGIPDQDSIDYSNDTHFLNLLCQRDHTLCGLHKAAVYKSHEGQIKGTAAVYEDYVIFGSWDFNIYAVNASTGAMIWRYGVPGISMSSASIDTDTRTVFIGCHKNAFFALSLYDGTLRWSANTKSRIMSSPQIVKLHTSTTTASVAGAAGGCPRDTAVLVGSFDGHIYGWCADTGDNILDYDLGARQISNEIVIDQHAVYVSTNGGQIIKLQ